MQAFGSYVKGAVKGLNAGKAIDFHNLKEAWLEAVGPVMAGQAEPKRIQGNTLHVTVSSPLWSQEIGMQQRLILGRLKARLRVPPTKINCWVGQPHAHTSTSVKKNGRLTPAEDRPPWADLTIPPSRQERIDQTLASLDDEAQRGMIRPLLEHAVRRELYFLEQGQLPCPICGGMRPVENESCDACLRERQLDSDRRLMRLMAKQPWLKLRDVQDVAPWASRAHLIRLRKGLRTDLLQQAWQLAQGTEGPELAARMTPKYRQLMLTITMLTCSLREESLKPRHFGYSLGKRLAQAYLGVPYHTIDETPAQGGGLGPAK